MIDKYINYSFLLPFLLPHIPLPPFCPVFPQYSSLVTVTRLALCYLQHDYTVSVHRLHSIVEVYLALLLRVQIHTTRNLELLVIGMIKSYSPPPSSRPQIPSSDPQLAQGRRVEGRTERH